MEGKILEKKSERSLEWKFLSCRVLKQMYKMEGYQVGEYTAKPLAAAASIVQTEQK